MTFDLNGIRAEGQVERSIQRLWLIAVLTGAGCGICLAMQLRQVPADPAKVRLDESLPFFFGGLLAGCLVGVGLAVIGRQWPGTVTMMTVVSAILLGTAFGGPIGWIYGDMQDDRRPDEGMAIGAALGGAIGMVFGLTPRYRDRRNAQDDDRTRQSPD